jgi:hypothetical protein
MRMNNDTSNIILPIVVGSFAISLFVGSLWLVKSRSGAILQKWAKENGFEILWRKQKFLVTGPFKWWTNSRNQTIFHLGVRDQSGRERSAWVRCGSYIGGVIFSDQIEVRWDEPPKLNS